MGVGEGGHQAATTDVVRGLLHGGTGHGMEHCLIP